MLGVAHALRAVAVGRWLSVPGLFTGRTGPTPVELLHEPRLQIPSTAELDLIGTDGITATTKGIQPGPSACPRCLKANDQLGPSALERGLEDLRYGVDIDGLLRVYPHATIGLELTATSEVMIAALRLGLFILRARYVLTETPVGTVDPLVGLGVNIDDETAMGVVVGHDLSSSWG